ncbi:S41 family peptidase [Marinicella sp. W31]|uniref:S41 family peptidase n=1 Tax=Marinicella sp. W31 TaxID=3023713 RepID=UPI003756745C
MHRLLICFVFLLLQQNTAQAQSPTGQQYAEDFLFLWQELANNYAYFDQRETDWDKVKTHYLPEAEKITSNYAFTGFLERVLNELYDNHTHLNTNTDKSPPLIPSGTDIHVVYVGGDYVIQQLSVGSEAAQQLQLGDVIETVDGLPLNQTVKTRWPISIQDVNNTTVHTFLANQITAGTRGKSRSYSINRKGEKLTVSLTQVNTLNQELLTAKRLPKNIAYIKIHNSLGDFNLIKAFDQALDQMHDADGLILDLRHTPSGGNTTVARGLMGRLISKPAYFQEHSIPAEMKRFAVERRWTEKVYPRGSVFSQPVVVLADNWTGSMGEGISIGLHGMGRAQILGAPMAGLLGGQYTIRLPNTGFGVNYIAEKLFHIDGTPREQFKPVTVGSDMAIKKASELLLN